MNKAWAFKVKTRTLQYVCHPSPYPPWHLKGSSELGVSMLCHWPLTSACTLLEGAGIHPAVGHQHRGTALAPVPRLMAGKHRLAKTSSRTRS